MLQNSRLFLVYIETVNSLHKAVELSPTETKHSTIFKEMLIILIGLTRPINSFQNQSTPFLGLLETVDNF